MNFLGDIRFGLRTLVKNPGFTAVAVAMLALGIGVNATVFTVTNAVLFKGFPLVEQNDRLVYITPKDSTAASPIPIFWTIGRRRSPSTGWRLSTVSANRLSDETAFRRIST